MSKVSTGIKVSLLITEVKKKKNIKSPPICLLLTFVLFGLLKLGILNIIIRCGILVILQWVFLQWKLPHMGLRKYTNKIKVLSLSLASEMTKNYACVCVYVRTYLRACLRVCMCMPVHTP